MFITLLKHKTEVITKEFKHLLQTGFPNQTTTTYKRFTFETDHIPKQATHIEQCKQLLTRLIASHPEITTMTKEDIAKCYTKSLIPKKTGGYRTINAPNENLKNIHRSIVSTLQEMQILEHDSAYAYIKNRGIYNALQAHQNNQSKWFLKIDLKNFFGSCSEKFIYQQLTQVYPFAVLTSDPEYDTIIKDLIKIACLDGVLPQGNPISPYLTNLIMVPIDYKLNKLCPVYTRYSDDMLFSARTKIDLDKTVKNITKVLKNTPLKINQEKTRLGSINGNNWNLGLMLNKDNNITLGHEKKRQFKATIDQFLYNPDKYSISEKQKLAGIIAYYLHIEGPYIRYIIDKYNKRHNKNLLELLHHPL